MILHDLVDVVRRLPTDAANAADRWVIGMHPPVEICDRDGKLTALVCRTCKDPWPCDEWDAANARIASRSEPSPHDESAAPSGAWHDADERTHR